MCAGVAISELAFACFAVFAFAVVVECHAAVVSYLALQVQLCWTTVLWCTRLLQRLG